MATMNDVVNGALKRLQVLNPRFAPDGNAGIEGLIALNDMMAAWKSAGVDIRHVILEGAEDFPLGDEHVQGTKALLAVRLAGEYGMEVDDGIVRDADMGWEGLLAEYVDKAPVAEFDPALTRLTLNRWGTY